MTDSGDWSEVTLEDVRRRQHEEFAALPFAEKLRLVEEMADLAREFAARRALREGGSSGVAR